MESLEESEEEDLEDIEAAIAEMKLLIKGQSISKVSRYQQIIRESEEFSKEDLQACEQPKEDANDNYLSLKSEVLSIIRQKID